MSSKQSTDTLKYLTTKSIDQAKNEKAPYLMGQVIMILVGFLCIFFGAVPLVFFETLTLPPIVRLVLESLGQALVVGTLISIIIDLPFMQRYYKSRIVDVLVGDEYLNSLPETQLEQLRKECTEKIYIKKTKHFEPTLLELDENITNLLTRPYISTYRIDITCKKENKSIRKRAKIKYWMENPLHTEATEKFEGKILLYDIPGVTKEDLFKIFKFKIKIDSHPAEDIVNRVEYVFDEKLNEKNEVMHYVVTFQEKDGKNITFRFLNTLEIEIEDERVVPDNDNVYTKRINHPTKNFQVHYSVIDMACTLQGFCMGTMLDNPIGRVRTVTNGNSISIESFDWLLPGNGIMIAAIPK